MLRVSPYNAEVLTCSVSPILPGFEYFICKGGTERLKTKHFLALNIFLHSCDKNALRICEELSGKPQGDPATGDRPVGRHDAVFRCLILVSFLVQSTEW